MVAALARLGHGVARFWMLDERERRPQLPTARAICENAAPAVLTATAPRFPRLPKPATGGSAARLITPSIVVIP